MKASFLAAMLTGAAPALAKAQICTTPAHPLFEFQVERAASYIEDKSITPRPARDQMAAVRAHTDTLLVQFIVDTLGVPSTPSLKFLRGQNTVDRGLVAAVLARWRFTPALFDGCRVPQLVQKSVEP